VRRVEQAQSRSDAAIPQEVAVLLEAWGLQPDGALLATRSSWLLPVRSNVPAMLKVARVPDERRGYALMRWWDGSGAAKVLRSGGDALLLERGAADRNLAAMAWSGDDDRATALLCATARRLHAARGGELPVLHPLEDWFRPLLDLPAPPSWLQRSADMARALLSEQRTIVPLHGDLHHENVLDFGARGWLAIDPHGLAGERSFDYANIFTNPDLSDPRRPLATLPGRLEARLRIVARDADIEPGCMLRWIVAWTGLSAAWFLEDGDGHHAAIDRHINEIAAGQLGI
jgi:streptomycin 6-kinase